MLALALASFVVAGASHATDKAWQVKLSSAPMRPCVVDGDHVVQGLVSGDLVSLAREDGAVVWRVHLGKGGFDAAPSIVDDVIVAGTLLGPALALDRTTGAVRWRAPIAGVSGAAVGSPPSSNGDRMILVGSIGGLVALDAKTGFERGRFKTVGGVPAVAVVGARVVFESFADGALIAADVDTVGAYAFMHEVWRLVGPELAHDVATGAPTRFAGFQAESIPVVDGVAYVPTNVAELWAVDVATGKKRWGYEPRGAVVNAPALDHGVLFLTATNGSSVDRHRSSRVIAVDAATGVERWAAELPGVLAMGGGAVVGDTLLVPTDRKQVLRFDKATGAPKPTTAIPGAGWWAPCTAADGTAFVGDESKRVTALH